MKSASLSKSRRRVLPVLLIILLILLLVLWYVLSRLRAQPKFTVTCESSMTAAALAAPEGTRTTPFLLQDQIIVTGPASAVDKIVAESPGLVEATPMRGCSLDYRGTGDLGESSPFPPEMLDGLTMRLYRVKSGQLVEDVLEAINDAGAARYVFADPNYLTGLAGQGACSSPAIDGSPYTIAGSPYTIAGSPYTIAGSPAGDSAPAAAELFQQQWAFEQIGLAPSFADSSESVSIRPTGVGARVGIFDTSPFAPAADGTSAMATIDWAATPFEMEISYPAMPTLLPSEPIQAPDVRDHGLFVAGLIHAVAPESQIRLIRVLNEYGCGDLFTLNEALLRFTGEVEQDHGALDGAIINLSLGILQPGASDEALAFTLGQDAIRASGSQTVTEMAANTLDVLQQDPIESLHTALLLAHERGLVIVAASGNDSYQVRTPLPPEIPAQYPFVVGVAASNIDRERACFSNQGDVYAPGGDGGPDRESGLNCAPKAQECSGNCAEAVISLALSSPTGYFYWSGTSFSTPLVSGLAARVCESGASGNAWVSSDQVFDAIRCGTATGDGVINIPATLSRCMP